MADQGNSNDKPSNLGLDAEETKFLKSFSNDEGNVLLIDEVNSKKIAYEIFISTHPGLLTSAMTVDKNGKTKEVPLLDPSVLSDADNKKFDKLDASLQKARENLYNTLSTEGKNNNLTPESTDSVFMELERRIQKKVEETLKTSKEISSSTQATPAPHVEGIAFASAPRLNTSLDRYI